jgi:carbon-monoxide dehydrogenase large subunit
MHVIESTEPWIGRRLPRADARRLVAGRGRYVDDVPARGELHAAFLRSPYPHAAFRVADLDQAAGAPGVAAILIAADLAAVCRDWVCPALAFPGLVSPAQSALADGRAAYQGEPVAMVLAASRVQAEDALEHIVVEWQELPAITDLQRALGPDAPRAHPDLTSNLAWGTELGGDVQAVFANAALVVEDQMDFARVTGVTLEPRGLLASWDPAAEALELRISHQMPHQLQLHLAELLDIRLSRVRVICGDVGGGFGVKMHVYQDEIAACAASRLLGRPVRFIADRMESLMADIHAREHVVRGRMAVDANGYVLGFDIDDLHGLGAYSVYPRSSTREAMSALQAIGAPYRFQHFHARLRCALQNKVPTGQLRAVGHPIGCAMTERLVDLAARARGEDPLSFRRRNLLAAEEQPWTNPVGGILFGLSHHACLDRLAALIDLPKLRAEIALWRDAGRCVGLGFAAFVEFTAPNARAYGPSGAPVAAVDTVTATLELSGEVTARASVSEIGQGVRQSLAQVIADAVGVAADQVAVETGDTGSVPHGGGAWASRGAAIGGEAAWRAGTELRLQVLRAAGALLQMSPEALDVRAGRVVERVTGADRMGLDEVARIVTLQGYLLPDGVQPQLSVSHAYRRERDVALPNNGIQASLVELDPETGAVQALRHWVAFDCGRLINPLLVEEQVRGGVVMGLGQALLEACRYDDAGQFVSGTLADYLVPMATDAPDIAVAFVETPYEGSTVGAKGAGEAGTCAAPAAILNAVNDALFFAGGSAVTTLPITPLAILLALGRLGPEDVA